MTLVYICQKDIRIVKLTINKLGRTMKNMKEEWVQIALDLTSRLDNKDRFERLLSTIRNALKCDASALLLFKNQYFSPLATNGLDSDLPDPYD